MDTLARIIAESRDPAKLSPADLRLVVRSTRKIAVVGVSRDPVKAARRVPSYLSTKGFEIIPVNPFAERILGRTARKTLAEVTEPVDMVLIFRPSAEAAALVEEASRRPDKPAIWLQEGILAEEAAAKARAGGVMVVQDLCIFKVHRALS